MKWQWGYFGYRSASYMDPEPKSEKNEIIFCS